MFQKSIEGPKGGTRFVNPEDGMPSLDALRFLEDIWSWVVSGYVTIPCDLDPASNYSSSGTLLILVPRLQPNKGGSGYAHLLPFSFLAEQDSPSVVFAQVSDGENYQDILPVMVSATGAQATAGDIFARRPYLLITRFDGDTPHSFWLK